MVTARQKVVGGSSRVARSGSIDRESACFVFGPGRDSDLSIGTHGERALSDAPLMVLHVSGITASPVSRHKATRSQEAKGRSRASASEGSIGNLMVSLKKAAKHNSHRRCDVANRQPPCARSRAPSKQGKSKKISRRAFRSESNRTENAPRSPSRRVRTEGVPVGGSPVRVGTVREVREKK